VSELEFRRYDGSGALAMLDTLTEVYLAGYAGNPMQETRCTRSLGVAPRSWPGSWIPYEDLPHV
jgi:hypothetical protein